MTQRLLLFLAVLLTSCSPRPEMNVILVIVDDLGWKDLTVTGSELYQTPHIDAFAESAVRFERFYADSPVCSPTRAALMTGKHPARLDITNWIGGEQKGQLIQATYERHLPLEETTIAERFKEAGYATGFIGKWHLGDEGFYPENQGFDVNIGGHGAGQPASYFWPYKRENGSPWDVPGLEEGNQGEYLTDRLTDEALDFIDSHPTDPFFLVLSHYSVHTPIQAKDSTTAPYLALLAESPPCDPEAAENDPVWSITRTCQGNAAYAAMVESTDDSMGRLVNHLTEQGLSANTAIVLVSDNGGLSSLNLGRKPGPTSNKPLRAGKGYLYEGGIRIPFLVSNPRSSSTGVRSLRASTIDVVPTLLDLAGLESAALDGRSLLDEAEYAGTLSSRPLFFHFPHYHGSGNRPSSALIVGDYKLIQWLEDDSTELYHLSDDPGELHDLSELEPLRTEDLLEQLNTWRSQIDANMPYPNPDWSRAN
ncbi:MAG: sulfatase [Rhodothermales bacterium]|nr:sulfatase [Rhodothermales bacterium]MDG2017204.1 sulfatase [Rhodothermales bacterium]